MFFKSKKNHKCQCGSFSSNYFPGSSNLFSFGRTSSLPPSLSLFLPLTLSVSLSLSLSVSLCHIKTIKLRRRESLAPSLSGEKKSSGSIAICILYHVHQKSHAEKDLSFLIGRNLRERD